MGIGRLLAAVACAMVLTAPSTAAASSVRHYQPAVMTMEYTVDGLHAVVHAPRTLVGARPLVFGFRGYEEVARSSARQGSVVVVIDEPQGRAYYGGDIAAPVFANIVSGALRVLAVPPDARPAAPLTVVAQARVAP